MFIKALYDGEKVLLNTDYIVDIWNYKDLYADAYVLDDDRCAYRINKMELKRFLEAKELFSGCDNCKYDHVLMTSYPCDQCEHNFISHYEPKEVEDLSEE